MAKNRLLLIDGHHLLFQMFYGMPAKIPSLDGKDIRAPIGFVGAVTRLIAMTAPTHVAVIFDSQTHNPRVDMMEEYKANRPDYSEMPEEENPFSSLPIIYDALDAMNIPHTEATDCECDDVIAGYALHYKNEAEIVISSHDSDYFQLICDTVRVVRYRGDSSVLCDEAYVMAKFATRPEFYADAKALFGDTADNVRGIRGIGPKLAARLVNTYGHLEDILNDTSVIKEDRLRRLVEENRDTVRLNYSLIKLSEGAVLPFSLDEMLFDGCCHKTMDVMRRIGVLA